MTFGEKLYAILKITISKVMN